MHRIASYYPRETERNLKKNKNKNARHNDRIREGDEEDVERRNHRVKVKEVAVSCVSLEAVSTLILY